ncbi:hypothetical protein ONJ87_25250, partial [Salmonella enterica subsp. enterica serovar Anatum]|nr:hypothetical protein [Salmonella enterica subsp. enterica serovar Anatum]
PTTPSVSPSYRRSVTPSTAFKVFGGCQNHCFPSLISKCTFRSSKGYEFINDIKGGVIPGEYIPAVDKGIQEQLKSGPLAGYPVVDLGV